MAITILVLILILPPSWLIKADKDQIAKAPQNSASIQKVGDTSTLIETRPGQANTVIKERLKGYLKDLSITYGLDYEQLEKTIEGESGFNPNAVGVGGVSVGISQFLLETFLHNCSDKDERKDPIISLNCMVKMWSQGNAYLWDAYCQRYYDEKCIKIRRIYPIK